MNYEIARTAETVRAAPLGDIRLAWWREALYEIHAGKSARVHPALEAYAQAYRRQAIPHAPWAAMIQARGADLDPAPFSDLDAMIAYIDATAGSLMRLAVSACAPGTDAERAIVLAARAWGLTGLLRAAPVWSARGRILLPPDVSAEDVKIVARAAYAEAREARIPASVFPAIGYVSLTPYYLRAPDQAQPLLKRQLRLIAASATGRP